MNKKVIKDVDRLLASEMKNLKGGNALAGCTCKRKGQLCVSGFSVGVSNPS